VIGSIERAVLRVLKVPPPPVFVTDPEPGAQVFRASRNYYNLRRLGWTISQLSAAIGIVVFLWFTGLFNFTLPHALFDNLARQGVEWPREFVRDRVAGLSFLDGMWILEILGIAFFVVQLPISYTALELDYEMRWYALSDRSLRIRSGVRHVREQTLSLANIQNVKLEQGPLERLFGFAGVKVRTAGGGASGDSHGKDEKAREKSMHVGWLRGLDDAEAVRDRILAAVRRHRDAGVGGPVVEAETGEADPALNAARALLEEVRRWRREFASDGPGGG
jgi:hypothetical protein